MLEYQGQSEDFYSKTVLGGKFNIGFFSFRKVFLSRRQAVRNAVILKGFSSQHEIWHV